MSDKVRTWSNAENAYANKIVSLLNQIFMCEIALIWQFLIVVPVGLMDVMMVLMFE